MLIVYKWIEGDKNLHDYCLMRFKEKPKFVETIGKVGEATVELSYKMREGHGYVRMYLLYMKHPSGIVTDIENIRRMTYEEIRADRASLLDTGRGGVCAGR